MVGIMFLPGMGMASLGAIKVAPMKSVLRIYLGAEPLLGGCLWGCNMEETWNEGEKNRMLQVKRPCPCGTCQADGVHGVGYLTGSDAEGNGFVLWIESEEVYQMLAGMVHCPEVGEKMAHQMRLAKGV